MLRNRDAKILDEISGIPHALHAAKGRKRRIAKETMYQTTLLNVKRSHYVRAFESSFDLDRPVQQLSGDSKYGNQAASDRSNSKPGKSSDPLCVPPLNPVRNLEILLRKYECSVSLETEVVPTSDDFA